MYEPGETRGGKDVVKVLENGSSVADHAESHVQWILLVGGNNFFRTDVRFRRPFLAGEPRGYDELLSRNAPHSGQLSCSSWTKKTKQKKGYFLESLRYGFLERTNFVNIVLNDYYQRNASLREIYLTSNSENFF